MNKLKIFEAFAGYGGASFALKKIGIDFECVGYSEIDKYAIECYEQNHFRKEYPLGTGVLSKNYGDMTKINPEDLPDFDLFTGGFPCQAFSVAGKRKGELDSRGTLFYEIIRICEVKKPKYILLENVKGLTNKKFKPTFQKMLGELRRIGYDVRWKVLNTKHYGVPQNRERVFFVCKLGEWNCECPNIDYSKGKLTPDFEFPQKEELRIFLKDILEEEVDEKYYLSGEQIEKLVKRLKEKKGFPRLQTKEVCSTLLSRDYKDPKIIQLNDPGHSNNRVYSPDGISPTINTMQGGNRQPFIVAMRKAERNKPKAERDYDGQQLEPRFDGTSNSITTVQKDNLVWVGKIRKLTPKECFRLMGFLNDEINVEGISNSQQYKLAGNGWDINLVSKIFREMLKD